MPKWRYHQFFWRCFISLVNLSYWSKFHVNIITGSGVMTIFFSKRLTRNPEIRNITVWVLPSIWRLGWVRDTKFGTNVSNKRLLSAAKCQGYSFYHFWLIKGKPQIRVNNSSKQLFCQAIKILFWFLISKNRFFVKL